MGDQFGGALYVGSQGKILCGSHGAGGLRIIPESKMQAYKKPAPSIPRSIGHRQEWVAACKGGPPPLSNFNHSGPAMELMLLGNVGSLFGEPLEFDPVSCTIANNDEANRALRPEHREGWAL